MFIAVTYLEQFRHVFFLILDNNNRQVRAKFINRPLRQDDSLKNWNELNGIPIGPTKRGAQLAIYLYTNKHKF